MLIELKVSVIKKIIINFIFGIFPLTISYSNSNYSRIIDLLYRLKHESVYNEDSLFFTDARILI